MARSPLVISTERLTISMLDRGDVTEFTCYRNLDEVARYQDWPMPFTRDLAHELIDEMEALDGPARGRWAQLGLRIDDQLIGDVAVWLDDAGQLAMIGYTLAPSWQGHGYATEAVVAVVDYLFSRRRVHRVAATLDPANLASARVLERVGFRHVGVARSAAYVRGEWSDDDRYSVLADEWRSWRRRDRSAPANVDLIEVTSENVGEVYRVEIAPSQARFVAPVSFSLAQALTPHTTDDGDTTHAWYRAIVADGEIVGFVMIAEPTSTRAEPYLWRLSIDHRNQGRGIGRRAIDAVISERRARGDQRMLVSYVATGPGNPAEFYTRMGFVPTGNVEDGETEAVLDITGA